MSRILALILILFLAMANPSFSQKTADSADLTDAGVFKLYIQGNPRGKAEFFTNKNGTVFSKITLNLPGYPSAQTLSATYENGALTECVSDSGKGKKIEVNIHGGKGKRIVNGNASEFASPKKVYLFATFSPNVLRTLVLAYDKKIAGHQSFDVLMADTGKLEKGILKLSHQRKVKLNGKQETFFVWTLRFGQLEIILTTDAQNRIAVWVVPDLQQKYTAVRNGYEAVGPDWQNKQAKLSQPIYETTVDTAVMIPMRDGVKCCADIVRPNKSGSYPVIVNRTPYNRAVWLQQAEFYAKRGYVYISQDVRGKYGSEGVWEPFVNERCDGFDTIEWAAKQDWSNGNVGMIGESYGGWAQWWAAAEKPSALKALIPIVPPAEPFFNIPWNFGTFLLNGSLWWANIVANPSNKQTVEDAPHDFQLTAKESRPLNQMDSKALGAVIDFYQTWLKHPAYDEYWDRASYYTALSTVDVPALLVSGWFDGDHIGTKHVYERLRKAGKKNIKLIYGPWHHLLNSGTALGHLEFGAKAVIDLDSIYLRWFDRWLKGVKNGIDAEPPVSIFIINANEWMHLDGFPSSKSKPVKYYLRAGDENAKKGRLLLDPPKNEKPCEYDYNPDNPWTPGNLSGTAPVNVAKLSKGRTDVLTYETEPYKKETTIAGPVSLILHAESSALDTDWFARVSEVYPDGAAIRLCEGIIRARFRNSWRKPELLEPGKIYQYELDLWSIGAKILKDHKLRVEISSSNFPTADANTNTGGNPAADLVSLVAKQKIHHDSEHLSYLMLYQLP